MVDNRVIMQQIEKRIDQKLNTIHKLQANFRQKRFDYTSLLSGNHLDLPPIASVFVSFPSAIKQKADIKNTPKRRNIIELDRLLENKNQRATNDELNRIIFASPMKNRMTFQRTFFRSSLYCTVEDKRKLSIKPKSDKLLTNKGGGELTNTPLKSNQQNQKVQQLKTDQAALPIEPNPQKSNMLDCNPHWITQRRRKDRNWRKTNNLRLPSMSLDLQAQRYSPWKNDELEEQLIL